MTLSRRDSLQVGALSLAATSCGSAPPGSAPSRSALGYFELLAADFRG